MKGSLNRFLLKREDARSEGEVKEKRNIINEGQRFYRNPSETLVPSSLRLPKSFRLLVLNAKYSRTCFSSCPL